MKRHRFTKWNKERISVYASAALVLGVCVVSGIYATHEAPSKTQIIDMESADEGEAYPDNANMEANAGNADTLYAAFKLAAKKAPEMGVAAMAVSLIVVPVVSMFTKKYDDKFLTDVFAVKGE